MLYLVTECSVDYLDKPLSQQIEITTALCDKKT